MMATPRNPLEAFIWGAGGAALTPDEIARRREEEATALAKGGIDMSPVYHPLQGLGRVAQAAVGAYRRNRLDKAQGENDSYNQTILKSLFGGSEPSSSAIPMTGGASEESATTPGVSPDIRSGIIETATALGIDPVDLGTAISYETAGTFDPTKKGPTTQWGQHQGFIQFGEPQAQKYGVDWANPVGSQLGADGAVAKYLRDTGVEPGMGLMDIYSAINAGGVGRYSASDANNGGAPGTVADKVNKQMAGHRAKALALIGDGVPPGQAVAATAAEGGVPAESVAMALTNPSGENLGSGAINNQMVQPTQATGQADTVAQALTGGQQSKNGINPAILRALADPRANAQTRGIAELLLNQQQQTQQQQAQRDNWLFQQQYAEQAQNRDPLRQAQIEKLQREAANPGSDESFFGNPVAVQNADGSISYGQIGNRGSFKPIQLGDGQSFAPPTRTIDGGTETIMVDQAGNVISRTPKENRAAARETAIGSTEGKTMAEQTAAAPGDYQGAQNALDLIGSIRNDPYRERGTGASSLLNAIPGSGGYDFAQKVEQAKSGAFLTAIQQMKGMGALSNAEGQAATAAITRINTAMSEEGFTSALDDYEKIVKQAMERAAGRLPADKRPSGSAVSIGGYTIEEVD